MKTYRRLVTICILVSFEMVYAMAQLPEKLNNQTTARNSVDRLPVSCPEKSWLKSYSLILPASCIATLPDISNRSGHTFGLKYDELLTISKISLTETKGAPGKLRTYQNSGSFNSKWEKLTGKPVIDTSKVYGYISRPSKQPVLSDSRLYRGTAFIFNSMMSLQHPQAYQPAKYPLTDKTK